MPVPTNKAAVYRFLGMCQYLSKFCHNLSETVLPLRNFSKDDSTFLWSVSHETALNAAKSLVASTTGLRYYDPHLPVTLQVDASDNAVGGVYYKRGTLSISLHTPSPTQKETMLKSRNSVLRLYPAWINGITTYTVNMTSKSTQATNHWRQSLRNPWPEPSVDCKERCWSCRNIRLPFVIRKRKSFLQTLSRAATSVHDDRTPTVMQECVVFHIQFYNRIGQSFLCVKRICSY